MAWAYQFGIQRMLLINSSSLAQSILGGAHNWILQLGFAGGLSAIILMLLLTAALFWQLQLICSNVHTKLRLKKLVLVTGLSFLLFI